MTETPTKAKRMRNLLRDERTVISPGVYDGYSILMVEAMGFKTAGVSGSALSNSLIGQPDIGIMSLRENVDACRHLARSVSIPLMADADTGYGNAVSVYHVVQYFEEAGIVGINIEDQVWPKRCGHMNGKELISAREMAAKIEAAVKAKKDPDFIINARTDAIAVEGIDETIERLKIYAAAGADMIYPDAVRDEDDIKRVVEALPDVPLNIGMGFGIRSRPTTPLLSPKRMKELGIARASMPRMMSAAALAGMKAALSLLKCSIETGELVDRPDLLVSMEEITALVGYERINKLEQELTTEEELLRKYGNKRRDYVIHDHAEVAP
jgi:2-methylisocitrate lyase-like PEP mutase family enzyme